MSTEPPDIANEAQEGEEEPKFSAGDEVVLNAGMYTQFEYNEDGSIKSLKDYRYRDKLTLNEDDAERSDANLIFATEEELQAAEEGAAEEEGAATVEEEQPDYDELSEQLQGLTVDQAKEYLSDATFTDDTLEAALQA